jgi:N-acetylmuramoyl-L-alanine amidase/FtsZ-binding cell division protein ZapB
MYHFGFAPGHGSNTYEQTGSKGFKLNGTIIEEHTLTSMVVKHLIAFTDRDSRLKALLPQKPNSPEVSLKKRAEIINNAHKTNPLGIYYSIHMDYNDNYDIRGWGDYKWYKSTQGKKAAKILRDNKRMMPIPYKWSWQCKPNHWTNYYIVRETACPVVLIELGFFSNKQDRDIVTAKCRDIAYWIYACTCQFFGIPALPKDTQENFDWAEQYYTNVKDIIKATRKDFSEELTRASAFVFFSNMYDLMKKSNDHTRNVIASFNNSFKSLNEKNEQLQQELTHLSEKNEQLTQELIHLSEKINNCNCNCDGLIGKTITEIIDRLEESETIERHED